MISLTGEYALRALIYLAQNSGRWPISGSEIAEQAGIPPRYLSAILSELARHGVLESARGKSGGFSMVRPAEETSLLEVLTPFEAFHKRRCPFGNVRCNDADPCLAHESWKRVVGAFQEFLGTTSVKDVALKRKALPHAPAKRRGGGGA